MLNQVADGVWVRQSEWVWSNAIVVRGEGGLILVDPGIDGSDLNQLADDVDRLGIPVVAGFSTHPHWDHLLWHSRFDDVPRYATSGGAQAASEARQRAQTMATQSASGIPLELIGLTTPRCPRTADQCRARSSSIRRTPSATPRSSSRTVAS
jgi:glyoxylase-like metal-dependent hydrolase (beta-lactamase superfamily II)